MKRRKGLWIACAAIAAVTLGALAATHRPVPYEFLRGAALARGASSRLGQDYANTRRAYIASGTLESVVAKAKAELTPEKGWEWNAPRAQDPFICENAATETWIAFYHSDEVPLAGPRRPAVIVVRPTRFGDGFFTWVAGL
jgi:hypothetical protein